MLDSIKVCSFDHSILGHILKNQTISDFQWSMEAVWSDNVPSQTSASPKVIPVNSPFNIAPSTRLLFGFFDDQTNIIYFSAFNKEKTLTYNKFFEKNWIEIK